jgi:acetyltransferase-like isoleucine patch superfamily enzyme
MKRLSVISQAPRSLLRSWLKHQQLIFANPGSHIGFPVSLHYQQISSIHLSQNSSIGAFSEIVVITESQDSKIAGKLIIQESVSIGAQANIRAAGGEIFIGRNSILAQQVSLIAANHQILPNLVYRQLPWDESKTGIYIGENVWIGAGVTVLPGSSIGNNSIVGAGSVVTKSIPANEIWAGVPAKKIRDVEGTSKPSLAENPEQLIALSSVPGL